MTYGLVRFADQRRNRSGEAVSHGRTVLSPSRGEAMPSAPSPKRTKGGWVATAGTR